MGKKILLVQLYSNGDCLYATAVARQIKLDFPGCHLTWAIASFCKDIIANNPFVDDVLEVSTVPKNIVRAYRKFKRQVFKDKRAGRWDEVVITNLIDENQANYDGSIRSGVFRGYKNPITVPVTPVLRLLPEEITRVEKFAAQHRLANFKHVVLFEFAPQSKQSPITPAFAIQLSEMITERSDVAVILSSAIKVEHPSARLIDGSDLTLRETAALTHYCSLLLGSSSGITWIATSDAAKHIPMIQLLDPFTPWVNAVSRDFKRFGLPDDDLIELLHFDVSRINACVLKALESPHAARKEFHQALPQHFRATRYIVYNLLCYLHFNAIARHVRINRSVYGDRWAFYKEVIMGFLILPFRLISNTVRKRILKSGR